MKMTSRVTLATVVVIACVMVQSCGLTPEGRPVLPEVVFSMHTTSAVRVDAWTNNADGLVIVAVGEGDVDIAGFFAQTGFPLIAPVQLRDGGWVAAKSRPEGVVESGGQDDPMPDWATRPETSQLFENWLGVQESIRAVEDQGIGQPGDVDSVGAPVGRCHGPVPPTTSLSVDRRSYVTSG